MSPKIISDAYNLKSQIRPALILSSTGIPIKNFLRQYLL